MRFHPSPLYLIITVSPFTKWGVDFIDCNPASAGGHNNIIVVIEKFKKSKKVIPIIKSNGETTAHFVLNHIITRFSIPEELVTDHGRHFENKMMAELALKLGYKQENSSSYC